MKAAFVFAVVIVCLTGVKGTDVPAGEVCEYEGQTYPEGEFWLNPCSSCLCRGGEVNCALVDCFYTPCVDWVHDPEQCCPVCPNGNNCRAPDNSTVAEGETVELATGETCTCDPYQGGYGPVPLTVCITYV
ncbi:hypothetical protein V1264_015656 [Littorina saxatilis]|uniref:VWFC domain-containing protein n=1 Tax=Littorina saxatilis TaxID=31220 RepID=A0AAN9BM33_9CAEN